MYASTRWRLPHSHVTLILWSVGAVVVAQEPVPPMVTSHPAYQVRQELTAPAAVFAPPGGNRLVSAARDSAGGQSLAERLDAVEAELKKLNDKEAEAKKAAASQFSVKPLGVVHMDWFAYNQDNASKLQYPPGTADAFLNGFEFRRVRLALRGSGFEIIDYMIDLDFGRQFNPASSEIPTSFAAYREVFVQVNELPYLGHVRVGHFKEPFGLEQLSSDSYITFMERSIFDEGALVPARNPGVMAWDNWADDRGVWAIGAFFSEAQDRPPVWRHDNSAMAMTARATYLPWYDEATEGRGLWHTGMSYSYRHTFNNDVNIAIRPESHLAPLLVNLAVPNTPDWQSLGAETALVYGPLSVQSEFVAAFLDRTAGLPDAYFYGYYVYFSYFLSGEHRIYNKALGGFDRLRPFENFFRVRAEDGCVYTGKGAWEVAYRWSTIDLDDAGVTGGVYIDNTVGLNWYLTPFARLMFNYVHSDDHTRGLDGHVDAFQMRAQLDF